jgi:hypothetical protein
VALNTLIHAVRCEFSRREFAAIVDAQHVQLATTLYVVGLGEGRPPATETDVPDNGLDPMVTMVPVRGGRVAPPIKAAISVNLVADTSAPVWAAATVGGMTAGASATVWAAATAPLGVRCYPLHRLLSRCLPRQLELVIGAAVG